ncbi:DMT family transporter [Martelella lutilitoris]|uniref:DMT family transporter n=1 Tax=Martelella lutilitoris TaxID=2583532 RepID=A0A5C4JLD2_9HYPH|nr:DMT family transporter [Martelella lutilitoris]TNB45982.1 DMT family transporter [Martelella lutilitoris]
MTFVLPARAARWRPDSRLVAIFLMIGGVAAFTFVDTLTKMLTSRHEPVMLVFVQSGLAAAMVLPIAASKGRAGFTIKSPRLLLIRSALGVLVSFLIFTSLSLLPFTVASSLFQLETFFVIPLAIVLLKEKADWRRWLAVALGLAGAFLILRPGSEAFQLAGLVAIAAAIALAAKNIVLKMLAMNEAFLPALFWMYALMAAIAAIPAMFFWSPIGLGDLGLLLLSALLVNTSNYCMLRAFSMADAVVLTPALHMALPLAVMMGLVVFGEWPQPIVWAGIALIFAATFMPTGRKPKP